MCGKFKFSSLAIALLALPALGTKALATEQGAPAPSAWGMLSQPKACVIFREYKKTKVGFFVVVVTAKTHGELEVVEATNGYAMEKAKWIEDDASMEELQHLAIKDGLRYVKIQDKYTPEDIEAARSLCHRENVSD